jgi:hypothetical protein
MQAIDVEANIQNRYLRTPAQDTLQSASYRILQDTTKQLQMYRFSKDLTIACMAVMQFATIAVSAQFADLSFPRTDGLEGRVQELFPTPDGSLFAVSLSV